MPSDGRRVSAGPGEAAIYVPNRMANRCSYQSVECGLHYLRLHRQGHEISLAHFPGMSLKSHLGLGFAVLATDISLVDGKPLNVAS